MEPQAQGSPYPQPQEEESHSTLQAQDEEAGSFMRSTTTRQVLHQYIKG